MLRVVSHPLGSLPAVAARSEAWQPELDAAIISAGDTSPILKRLHEPGALVVTSGQQPGLFTGPAYTVHKALAAAALARTLERRWGRPVIPMFWVAGDDHDFVEASTTSWLDSAGQLIDWGLAPRPASAPQLPMSAERLPAEVKAGLDLLEHGLPSGVPRDETMGWLRRHYLPGATLHSACATAVAELLAPFGVLCFDPTHPAAKRAQMSLIIAALDRAAECDAALAAVHDPGTGIRAGDGASLIFITTAAGRERLVIDGKGFRARRSGQIFTRKELETVLAREPERFSPNVLLRPVVESALLPTVAYVAGPAEVAYQTAQSSVLYPLFDVRPQTPVPRWSGTVVPRWAERLLGRLHLTANQVLDDDGTLARAILERDFPGDARQAIEALRKQIERSGGVIAAAGKRIDPVLDRALTGRAQRIGQITDDIEAVFLRHLRRRNDIAHAQFERLNRGLRPHGQPQERVLCAPAFLGQYGTAWLNALFEPITDWAGSVPQAPA